MKKTSFMSLVVTVQVICIFLYIRQTSQYMQQSYKKQDLDKHKKKLANTKQALTHSLYQAKNRSSITKFATTTLAMSPVSIAQVRKLSL